MSTEKPSDKTDEPAHPYETEESFHPLGKEWEDRMREDLEDTDFDADLGMQMARDAQRLVAGEISEDEFYSEYHDDVEEEFEVDERPVFDDVSGAEFDDIDDNESMLEALRDIDLEGDEQSRREVMKKMGAGAAFLGYGVFASYDNGEEDVPESISGVFPADEDEREHRWGMVIDLERCDGCLACVTGCVDENGTSTGANWMYVFAYEDEDNTDEANLLVRPCQHCSNAPCAKVCPVRARHTRSKDGLVLTDYETCIGCRYCQVACPYGVNYFQWGEPNVPMDAIEETSGSIHQEFDDINSPSDVRALDEEEREDRLAESHDHVYDYRGRWVDSRPPQGVMGKCTMCPSRQDGHTEDGHGEKGTVACMDACDAQGMSAIHFGDLDAEVGDEYDRAVRYLERRTEERRDVNQEQSTMKFEADHAFAVNAGGELDDIDDGYHPLYYVGQRTDGEEPEPDAWRLIDEDAVVVTDSPAAEPADDGQFGLSVIQPLGGTGPGDIGALYTDDPEQEVTATITYDDDEFDEEDSREFDVELQLGAQTVAEQTVTLTEEEDEVDEQLQTSVTFTVDGEAIEAPEGQTSVLFLLVEEVVEDDDGDETMELRQADARPVFVSADRPAANVPSVDYQPASQDGELFDVPQILYRDDDELVIEGEFQYPTTEQSWTFRLFALEDDAVESDVAEPIEYDFDEEYVSNTPWGGQISSFRLLEDLGTDPNVIYLGNEPGPNAEQVDGQESGINGALSYDQIDTTLWGEWMEIIDDRSEHLQYGADAGTTVNS